VTAIGLLLLFVGVAVIIPSGSTPGSTAGRNLRMGDMRIEQTPGHRDQPPTGWKRSIRRVLVGLALMAVGLYFVDAGLRAAEPELDGAPAAVGSVFPREPSRVNPSVS
jgi:hypothetical protein